MDSVNTIAIKPTIFLCNLACAIVIENKLFCNTIIFMRNLLPVFFCAINALIKNAIA